MILCADFTKILEGEPADLVLTDPPYGISRPTGFSNTKLAKYSKVTMDFGEWDSAPDAAVLANKIFGALNKGGTAIVFWDIWKLSWLRDALAAAGFRMLRLVIWEKTNPVPLNSKRFYLTNSREVAVCAVKGRGHWFEGEYHNGKYLFPIPRSRRHPTQKPVELFVDLIERHCPPGGLVLDPFLGSGTTAVAAARAGRRFRGGDIDPVYAETARAWAAGEAAQGRLL